MEVIGVLVSDVGAIVAAGLFGVGLGVGIIGGAEIGRIIHRATDTPDTRE